MIPSSLFWFLEVLITEEAYAPMTAWLKQQGVLDAQVVPVTRLEWLLTTWGFGWRRVLDRVDAMVQRIYRLHRQRVV